MRHNNSLPPFWARANILALLLIVIFAAWAWFTEVDITVKGQGRTLSSSDNKQIQHLEGGIIADILVQEGSFVKAGDTLFRVRNESNNATLAENTLELSSLKIRLARLQAESNGKAPTFTETQQTEFPETIEREKRLFQSGQQQRKEEQRVVMQQIAQKRRSLEEQTSRIGFLNQELATAEQQLAIIQKLVASRAASQNRMLDVQGRVEGLRTELNSTKRGIPVTRAELNEAQNRLNEVKARQKQEVLEQLREVSLQASQLKARLKADTDKVQRTEILAPVNGKLNQLYRHTIGGTIQPGEVLAEITPTDDALIVEAKILPKDRSHLWQGQAAKVHITAFSHTDNNSIPGKVIDISADSFTDNQNTTPYYRIKISLDAETGTRKILAGMQTEVHIIAGKRHIWQYLLKPLLRLKEDAFTEV